MVHISVHIWSFSGPHFPAFGLNTKMWTKKAPNTNFFSAVYVSRGNFEKVSNTLENMSSTLFKWFTDKINEKKYKEI